MSRQSDPSGWYWDNPVGYRILPVIDALTCILIVGLWAFQQKNTIDGNIWD